VAAHPPHRRVAHDEGRYRRASRGALLQPSGRRHGMRVGPHSGLGTASALRHRVAAQPCVAVRARPRQIERSRQGSPVASQKPSSTLWGSQSWLQPALSRLFSYRAESVSAARDAPERIVRRSCEASFRRERSVSMSRDAARTYRASTGACSSQPIKALGHRWRKRALKARGDDIRSYRHLQSRFSICGFFHHVRAERRRRVL
jgi:hypothetical protein